MDRLSWITRETVLHSHRLRPRSAERAVHGRGKRQRRIAHPGGSTNAGSITFKVLPALLALSVAVLPNGQPALVTYAAASPLSAASSLSTFDVTLYEAYVRVHHRLSIAYRDKMGHITPFAAAWMQHRRTCGGAITPIDTNPTTLSMIQTWQGCTAIRRIGERTIRFQSVWWIP